MQIIPVQNLEKYLHTEIVTYYIVIEKELREGAREPYIRLKLGEKTGSVSANIWNNAQHYATLFDIGDVVKIKGLVKDYKGQLQITINNIRIAEPDEYNLGDFIVTTKKDISELGDVLFRYIEGIKEDNTKQLLKAVFEDVDFFTLFAQSPAAKTWHHNYVGGLLEHTVTVTTICDFVSKLYEVDRDLLIAGALLHDIGKVYEYQQKVVVEFSNVGRLIGHINIADHIVAKKAEELDAFPADLLMKIRHLILSHHGEPEKGTARIPQIIEAIILHYADNLDAQTVGVKQLIEAVKKDNADWTEFDRINERYYYLK